ncbi:DUF4190 domain-containing protein [Streptomyces sp. NPDC056144]|uniref:DUF4190 domain-containing protein n=1 Tax=unclassified Streptomyces TaxID=2593676 RepID=UPI0035D6DA21
MEPTPPHQPPQPPQLQPPQQGGWPAPQAPGPYTSPGMPYAPGPYGIPPRPTTNGLAVASFVTGFVCCLPPLGLVLGLFALPQIKKKGQRGKGFAITGIVLSAVSCLLVVLGFATGAFRAIGEEFKEGMDEAARTKTPFSLRTGQCFDEGARDGGEVTDVEVLDCDQPHEGEVTGGFKLIGYAKWPGEKEIFEQADERCDTVNLAYARDSWAIPERLLVSYYYPTKESWRTGDRTVTCTFATDKKPVTGSVRADATTLTADQLAFLTALNPVEEAGYREPEEDPDEDFAGNKAWAKEMLTAIDGARTGLDAQSWPGASTAPVAALGKELDEASALWKKLATAPDADAYWDAYDAAWDALPEDLGADARTGLGLTDTLPERDGGGATGGGATGGGTGSA